MPRFFDLHCHMLYGVDDGAKTEEEMFSMLETAYEDGVRAICLTPHYSPYLFGDTEESSQRMFEILRAYAAEKHPDLQLFLGHELGYHHGCLQALDSGRCRCLNNSRYVLVDFPESVELFEVRSAIDQLQRAGYIVILAHTERYQCLKGELKWLEEFADRGGIIQLNAASICGVYGKFAEKQWKKLLRHGLAHIISSDGHNLSKRQPKVSVCMPYLKKHCTEEEVELLVWENAWRVVRDEPMA